MKRESLTAIIGTVQTLTLRALNNYYDSKPDEFATAMKRIRKAAVNEILRLEAVDPVKPTNIMEDILMTVANIPGSGYEHLKPKP